MILPETKGISLERMDKIFGQVDAVAAGEQEDGKEISQSESQAVREIGCEKDEQASHIEVSSSKV